MADRTKHKKPSLKDWQQLAANELRGKPLASLHHKMRDGITIKPLYTKADIKGLRHKNTLPGLAPFVRGPRATMYTGRPWTIRQYAGFSTAKASNRFYKRNLAAGQQGLSVAFDLPTHRGYDSDHPRVVGDVGAAGVAIDSVEDMKALFADIPLDQVSVSMTMNGAVLPVMASFIVAAEESGVRADQLSGTLQNDILKEFMVRNTYIYPPAPSMRITADIIAYTAQHMPSFNPISISGYHMQEAGATAVQELAFTLADGLEYVRTAIHNGLDVDEFAPRLSFFFGIGMDFFTEIAKLRAARLLWSQLMEEHFSPQNPRSKMLRTHCQTSGVSLTAADPYNNIMRTTIEAMAGVLGGTQSLHTNSFDEALALPSGFSAQLARNTQIILQEETGICDVVDPLGGSYYIESLTDQLAGQARALIDEVEAHGGMTRAVEQGMPKQSIEKAAALRQAHIDRGEQTIVGVNKYVRDEFTFDKSDEPDLLHIDHDAVRKAQIERLQTLKKQRNDKACQKALDALKRGATLKTGAEQNNNLLELSIAASRARATVGEITSALEQVFGRYKAVNRSISGVYGAAYEGDEQFEAIKAELATFKQSKGRKASMLVVKLGQDGHDRGARVIASAYGDMGFEVELAPLFQTPQEAACLAIEKNVHVIGISTLTAGHKTLVPQLLNELKEQKANDMLVICGGVIPPKDHQDLYDLGVAAIYGPGTDIPKSAQEILEMIRRQATGGNA